MRNRRAWLFVMGVLLGGVAGALAMGGFAAVAGWHTPAAHGHNLIVVPVQAFQPRTPGETPGPNPKEFIPIPHNGDSIGPGQPPTEPGTGSPQDCTRILYFYQGRLYQLRPGPMPRNGGNPEFFYMQPYEGPQIPGFGPLIPGAPSPDQPVPPTLKF